MSSVWKTVVEILIRASALFITSALGILSGAAIIGGVPAWKSALLAGFVSVAKVVEQLGRAGMNGQLTRKEIDEAFSSATSGSPEDNSN